MKKIISCTIALAIAIPTVLCGCGNDVSKAKGKSYNGGTLYAVGDDVQAGEYIVMADEYDGVANAVVTVYSSDPYGLEKKETGKIMVGGYTLHYSSYITLKDGQYVLLEESHLESADTELDTEIADVLKVGKDIPAGYYDFDGIRSVTVYDNSDVDANEIISLKENEEKKDIHLQDGMYVSRYDNSYQCTKLD